MPTIEDNREAWDRVFDWQNSGEEWSSFWGNSESQWYFSIYPRIHRFLPAGSILEIGFGFGRWTKFLLSYCRSLKGVDLVQRCSDHCNNIFGKRENVLFHCNDGLSLDMIEDNSIDFIFTFDSLVHVGKDVMDAYIKQSMVKLNHDGIAFMHHSNLEELITSGKVSTSDKLHGRDSTVSADLIKELVNQYGGDVLSQELINWGSKHLLDCITVFSKAGAHRGFSGLRIENYDYMDEAKIIRKLQPIYCPKR